MGLFDGLLGSIVGGGASLIGGMFQQSAAKDMVQQQEAFQAQMSNTAYQRASKDMTAAGLNPMMMFGGGSAASTPAGSIAPTGQVGQGISQSVNSALNTNIMQKTVDKLTEEIANVRAGTGLKEAETRTEAMRPQNVFESSRVLHTEADTNIAKGPQIALGSEIADKLRDYYGNDVATAILKMGQAGQDISKMLAPLGDVSRSLSSAGSAYRSFKGRTGDPLY